LHLGIDLGGTKIEVIVLNEQGDECLRQRVPTPQGDYQAILRAIVDLVSMVEAKQGRVSSIGVGAPGSVSRATGLLRNSNSVCLNGMPFKQDLELLLGRSVRLANDADCFVLSEASDGAATGAATVFGVILGTGVGGGIVVNGRLLAGPNGIAGEWGHNPLPWPMAIEQPGPDCYCGKQGCIETFLSGPGLENDYHLLTGKILEAREIVAGVEAQDVDCIQVMIRYEDRLARALAHIINILDPDVIVLGGGMSNISSIYQSVTSMWGAYVFSDCVATQLLPACYGDSSGVRGAAWLGAQ